MALRPAGFRAALLVGLATSATLGAASPPAASARDSAPVAAETGRLGPPRATPPVASNMGFRCEVDIPALPGLKNIYVVAVPYFFGLDDIANSTLPNPCDGAGLPDGIVNADDLLCNWWTSREGSMSVSRRDEPGGTWQTRTALRDDVTREILFLGTWTEQLVMAEGYLVQVAGPRGGFVNNPVVIVGSSDSAFAGHLLQLPASGGPQLTVINNPYHTMYRTADEILCGLEGFDWVAGPDGNPSTCPTGTGSLGGGIFDGVSGAPMTVMYFDNVADGNGTDNQWIWRTVSEDPLTGALVFEGTDFPLGAGLGCPTGYIASYGPPFLSSIFLSPHF